MQKTVVGRGLPFYTAPLLIENGAPRWDLVRRAAGGVAPRVVAPYGYPVPADCGLGAYYPTSFAGRVIFKAALAELQRNGHREKTVTLWDEAGTAAAEVCRLLPSAGEVRVITARPDAYEEARRRAMRDYGATLVLNGERQPNGVLIRLPVSSPVKGEYEILCCGGKRVTACDYCLPFRGWALPAGADGLAVAGAVSELCGLGQRAEGRFEHRRLS